MDEKTTTKMIGKSTLKTQHIHTKPVFRSITVSFNIILRYVSCFLFCFILSDTQFISTDTHNTTSLGFRLSLLL